MSLLPRDDVVCSNVCCRSLVLVGVLLLTVACARTPQTPNVRSDRSSGDWHEFQGTWTATGTRNVMSMENERHASISDFHGTLMLAGPSRPNVGFRAEAIFFNDTATGLIGRATWTDEHGDQAFSELRGQGRDLNKIVGTFTGGTGRFQGAAGDYEFSWRFVLESDDGNMQGESVGLKGRVRVDATRATSTTGEPGV